MSVTVLPPIPPMVNKNLVEDLKLILQMAETGEIQSCAVAWITSTVGGTVTGTGNGFWLWEDGHLVPMQGEIECMQIELYQAVADRETESDLG